jgi:hypothetical protein
MDSFALETLIVFHEGLIRRTKSATIVMLRIIAFTCAACATAGLGIALMLPETARSYLIIPGTAGLMIFLIVTLSCAALVARERRKE